jgi:hypothetical protein
MAFPQSLQSNVGITSWDSLRPLAPKFFKFTEKYSPSITFAAKQTFQLIRSRYTNYDTPRISSPAFISSVTSSSKKSSSLQRGRITERNAEKTRNWYCVTAGRKWGPRIRIQPNRTVPHNTAGLQHTKAFEMECFAITNPYCVEGSQALINPRYFLISFVP